MSTMELKEAFDIIDATLGMFRSFAGEIDNRDPKDKFLGTPVNNMVRTVVDEKLNPEIECKEYYNYIDGDREYKMYIVDIRPVCNYMVNEWPSTKAKKIRRLLYVVFRECLELCEEPLKGIIDVAIDEGYSYHMKYNASTQNSRTIETVMLDTIHEMYHALGLTEYAEPDVYDQNNDNGDITEDLANSIDWVKLTQNFNVDRIRDVVRNVGRTKRDKKIIIKAIYDAESSTGNMYKIPYSVDKLLNDLYREYDENHKGLFDTAYDANSETLYLDVLLKQAIDKYMATDEDIDEIFQDSKSNMGNQKENTEQLLQQIAELKAEVNKLANEKATIEKNNHDLVAREEHHRNEKDKARAENQTLLAQIAELKKKLAEKDVEPEFEPEDIMIAEDRKIDVIKILHAMCKIGVLQKKNGSKITQNTVMKLFGKMLNDDFSEYSSNLSTSKSKTKEPSYMQVFDELRKAAYDYFKKS